MNLSIGYTVKHVIGGKISLKNEQKSIVSKEMNSSVGIHETVQGFHIRICYGDIYTN